VLSKVCPQSTLEPKVVEKGKQIYKKVEQGGEKKVWKLSSQLIRKDYNLKRHFELKYI
jgi:hypothetical protein